MARTAEFTDEQIVDAGKQLKQSGKRITGFGLRNLVGGGNPQRLLEVWEQHETEGTEEEPELVSELPIEVADHLQSVINSFTTTFSERFTNLAREMNYRAVSASERRVKELTQAAEDKRQQAQAEIADAEAAVGKSEDDRDQALAHAQKLQLDLDQAKDADRQKGFELTQLKKDHEGLIKSSQNASDQAVKTIEALEAKASTLNKDFEKLRDESSKVSGQLDEARGLAAEQKQVIKELQAEASARTQELGKLQGKVEGQENQIVDLKTQVNTLGSDLKSADSELKSAQNLLRDRDSEIQSLKADLDQARKALESKHQDEKK